MLQLLIIAITREIYDTKLHSVRVLGHLIYSTKQTRFKVYLPKAIN